MPIYEPGLEEMLQEISKQKIIFHYQKIKRSFRPIRCYLLGITNLLSSSGDGSADLSFVLSVANQIGEMMTNYK